MCLHKKQVPGWKSTSAIHGVRYTVVCANIEISSCLCQGGDLRVLDESGYALYAPGHSMMWFEYSKARPPTKFLPLTGS